MRLSGFTYIEVLLTMALMIFIGIMASPFYGDFLFEQEVDVAVEELKASFSQARWQSMMGKKGTAWGVTLDGQQIVLFSGDTYGSRNEALDQRFTLHDRVNMTGLNEVIFERRTGRPSTEPVIQISLENSALSTETHVRVLRINAVGVVEGDF